VRPGDDERDDAPEHRVVRHGRAGVEVGDEVGAQAAEVGSTRLPVPAESLDELGQHLFLGPPAAVQRSLPHPGPRGEPVHGERGALEACGQHPGDGGLTRAGDAGNDDHAHGSTLPVIACTPGAATSDGSLLAMVRRQS
jgi:hypothetical protein